MKLSDARTIHSICEKIRQVEEEMIAIDRHARMITESMHEFSVQLHIVDETEKKRKDLTKSEQASGFEIYAIWGATSKKSEESKDIVAVKMDLADTLSVLSMMMQRKEKERKELVSQIKAIEDEN